MSASNRDLLAIAVLTVLCLFLRLPSVDRVALNPDESQYEATASYLAATGSSAFAFPEGVPGTFTLYKWMTRLFGAYPIFEMRVLVLCICLGMSLLLYFVVSRASNRFCGLVSGLVFLAYNLFFEGLVTNREWFAGPLVLAGAALYLEARRREGRRAAAMFLLAGAVTGGALWFKMQALFLLGTVPLVSCWLGLAERRLRPALREIGLYLLGTGASVALYLLQFLMAGTLVEYLRGIVLGWHAFVLGNEAAVQSTASGPIGLYLTRFFFGLPQRGIFLITYVFAAVVLVQAARTLLRHRSSGLKAGEREVTLVLFVAYLLIAMVCVQLGNRFFPHYYQFLMPPVSALIGLALHHFASFRGRGLQWVGAGLIVLLIVDRWILPLVGASPGRAAPLSALLPLLVYGGLVAFVLALVFVDRSRIFRWGITGTLLAEVVLLLVAAWRLPVPPSLPHHQPGFPGLTAYLSDEAGPNDRLFVWGWIPEIYSLTRLESATRFAISQYIVQDYSAAPVEPKLDRAFAETLMRELAERTPRFIVDGADRSWAESSRAIYRLDRYPDFPLVQMLAEEYEMVGRLDGCTLYVRR